MLFLACLISIFPLAAAKRVIAIGDLHGDVRATLSTLRVAGLVKKNSRTWAGGDSMLIQLGDMLDRGTQEREVWELLRKLQGEARLAGGQVTMLLGNHEILNVCGQAGNFVHPRALEAFGSDRIAAFAPGGELATHLANCPVVAIVDDTAYVHAALPPGATRESCEALNAETRAWLLGEQPDPPPLLLPDHHSPVWNRGYSSPSDVEPSNRHCTELKAELASLGVERCVVGHTPQRRINSACGDAVWRCDTGMSAWVMDGVHEALEICDGRVQVLRRSKGTAEASGGGKRFASRDFF